MWHCGLLIIFWPKTRIPFQGEVAGKGGNRIEKGDWRRVGKKS